MIARNVHAITRLVLYSRPTPMWHALHLIARPIEALLGVFCVLSAIALYPDEEGKIQSKFEDFWIRVDDFKNLALTRHAAFMTQVAKLETAFLDFVFGRKLISVQALGVSFCLSLAPLFLILTIAEYAHVDPLAGHREFFIDAGIFVGSLAIGVTCILIRHHYVVRRVLVLCFLSLMIVWVASWSGPSRNTNARNIGKAVFVIALLGLVCDIVFIASTRRLLRWAGRMTSTLQVMMVTAVNLLLAVLIVGPAIVDSLGQVPTHEQERMVWVFSPIIGVTNFFDALLALLFVLLATVLLIHRAFWPFLTRTLFRMADIGTKGRRAILTTVGIALLGTAVFGGKFPELLAKAIEKFGG